MARFSSDGVAIDYLDEGDGKAVLLVHGFASNCAVNWVNTGWVKTLVASGRRVVAVDNRGHGASEKLYEPSSYGAGLMAADAIRLLDHLELAQAALAGYSMGARIAAFAALAAPDRVTALVLSGLAANLVHGVGGGEAIARAMESPSLADVADANARAFRVFAEQTGSDRRALAACIRAARQTLSPEEVGRIAAPTVVVAGDRDTVAGSPDELAALIPGARAVTLPGKDHMTAVGDRGHKAAVLAFLDDVGA